MKICQKCKIEKEETLFHCDKSRPDGRFSWCKECANEYRSNIHKKDPIVGRKRTKEWRKKNPEGRKMQQYGLKKGQYKNMLQTQDFRCANPGCRTKDPSGPWKVFSIDHDHACCPAKRSCGKCIRGLLCHHCNIILGLAKDNCQVLYGLIEYINNFISSQSESQGLS